jgi:nicotinamide mononucleotide transporter
MTWLEAVAVAFGIASVWLTVRQNIWCWLTGLVQVTLYIYIFYNVKLYSDVLLNVVYWFLQWYGWYHWTRGGQTNAALAVSTLSPRARGVWLAAILLGSLGWGYGMATFTDAAAPYPDAFIIVASLAAQWLLTRKKLENWYLWVAVDVVGIVVYLSKGLTLTAGLYVVFLVLSLLGARDWRRSLAVTPQAGTI